MRTSLALLLLGTFLAAGQEPRPLPGTQPFTQTGDLSAQMVEGIDRWLDRETVQIAEKRNHEWQEAASGSQWDAFIDAHREKLRQILGATDPRTPGAIEETIEPGEEAPTANKSGYSVHRVRWPVFEGVHGEGLLFIPAGEPRAAIIVVSDADEPPERSAMAQRFARQGCLVLIPVLVDRNDKWSGSGLMKRYTNQPGREWIYRQGFELGRTIIGYETQKILAAVDALTAPNAKLRAPDAKLGIAGYGEGGLLALYCAALDPRLRATLVSGYFGPRERLYLEPIYRNLFGFLNEFGDAELAAMVGPRRLIIEQSRAPEISGPPTPVSGRTGAAPGVIRTPEASAVAAEVARANQLRSGAKPADFATLIQSPDGQPLWPGSAPAIDALLGALDVQFSDAVSAQETAVIAAPQDFVDERQRRAVRELERFTQGLIRVHELERDAAVWAKMKPGPEWEAARHDLQTRLWDQSIGRLTADRLPPNPKTRLILEKPKWTGYEVRLDVLPDVFAWGWLLVPRDLKPGERRPVIVCQHGLEGLPEDTVTDSPPSKFYQAFAARLADQGFIVYAPHNPYRGFDKFRTLQRRANPIGLSLFSFIIAQHDVTTQWLAGLPFVDPARIAFYGLSYGGKTAMRVPAMLDRYCLSICAGDFNEWIYKVVSTEYKGSYVFTGEYEMSEWNLAAIANHAEMAMLISPRPFMVERGHDDGVGADEWIGYEFAKVLHGYTKLGIPERAQIEWFDGPHMIHGVGTFEFLHKQLAWPPPAQ
jgi:dienelactone hydrolase